MRNTRLVVVLGVLVAALAASSALAVTGNPLTRKDSNDRQQRQAAALGKKLGIAPSKVSKALSEIHADRREARRTRRASELAKHLGVSPTAARNALAKGRGAARAAGKSTKPGKAFRAAVAKELGKSPAEVGEALKGMRRTKLTERLSAAERNGTITKKRADKLRKRIASGKLGPKVAGALR